jgi:predicted glycosyltransferase
VGRFDFPQGVDFVRIPGVVKLPSGDYASDTMHLDIAQTVDLRERILLTTAEAFAPDLLIVDKEPTGLRGEMIPTLDHMRAKGTRIVLGLRDVLDEKTALHAEWERKEAYAAIERFYDDIWVYGLREIFEPLAGLTLPARTMDRIKYTGYLRREAPEDWPEPTIGDAMVENAVLVTPGGGGDGEALIDWVLRAYETNTSLSTPSLLVFGPFMAAEKRAEFERRAHRFRTIRTRAFDSRIERLMMDARGVIAMGGYNTFCEILSFDKPAAIAPRTTPRMEQYLRVAAAAKIGLVRMLPPVSDGSGPPDPAAMVDAIRAFDTQPLPSAARIDGLLDGLDKVGDLTSNALAGVR